jgi:hypothetical protein
MVDNTGGQLYTIEGFAAAMIMLVTAWIVLGTTSVYTPGDTHISDMQLEQLGTDVLYLMDIPATCNASATVFPENGHLQCTEKGPLQTFIENKDGNGPTLFNNLFLAYCNNKTGGIPDNIQYTAWVYYRKLNETRFYELNRSRQLTQGDHAVRVSHWVLVDNGPPAPLPPAGMPADVSNRQQIVLVEVLLWKG